jgi:tetratricopeptide (TPR) repeat protein
MAGPRVSAWRSEARVGRSGPSLDSSSTLICAGALSRRASRIASRSAAGIGGKRTLLRFAGEAYTSKTGMGRSMIGEESIRLYTEAGDDEGLAAALRLKGMVLARRGLSPEARALWARGAELSEARGDLMGAAGIYAEDGYDAMWRGQLDHAVRQFKRFQRLATEMEDSHSVVHALFLQGLVATHQGLYEWAKSTFEYCLERRQAFIAGGGAQVDWNFADLRSALANLAASTGRYAEARRYRELAKGEYLRLGDKAGVAHCLERLAWIAINEGDLGSAHDTLTESLRLSSQTADTRLIAGALCTQAKLFRIRGELSAARAVLAESITLRDRAGYLIGCLMSLEEAASLFAALREFGAAVRNLSVTHSTRERLSAPPWPIQARERMRSARTARRELGAVAFREE